MSFGGHTVTFGNDNFLIGKVSMVVEIGFSDQVLKDSKIKNPAPVKQTIMTEIQKYFTSFFVLVLHTFNNSISALKCFMIIVIKQCGYL